MYKYTYDEYLKLVDEKANGWYKKMFVKFVKKYFPEVITQQYRKWQIGMCKREI